MSVISDIQTAWQSLSMNQINLWIAAATFYNVSMRRGRSSLNAHQLFLKYNGIRVWAGLAILTDPELISFASQDVTPRVWSDTGLAEELSFSVTVNDSAKGVLVKLTRPLALTQFSFRRYLRVIAQTWRETSQDVQSLSLAPEYFNRFYRQLVPGDLVGVSVLQFSKLGPFMLPAQEFVVTVEEE